MGGFGSGKGARRGAWRSKKIYMGKLPGLTVPDLIKAHKANPGSSFTFQKIKLTVVDSVIHLESLSAENLHRDTIRVASMPCHYGGVRYFGHCPVCEKRVVTLYLYGGIFACRHCFRMVYFSQNATLAYRLRAKRKKVGKKINNDEWTKPKWMRQKTFATLCKEYSALDEKEQLADFFSLRNNRSLNAKFEECPLALYAIEDFLLKHFPPWG